LIDEAGQPKQRWSRSVDSLFANMTGKMEEAARAGHRLAYRAGLPKQGMSVPSPN